MTRCIVVTNTAEETAGSIAQPVERDRHEDAGKAGDQIVDQHGRAHHRAEQRLVEDQRDARRRSAARAPARSPARSAPRGRMRGACSIRSAGWWRARAPSPPASGCRHCRPCRRRSASARRARRIWRSRPEQPTTRAATIAVPRLTTSQLSRRRDGQADRLVDVALAPRRRAADVLARFLLDDVDDVVDGDHADQPARLVDHRGRDEGIFLEAERDFLLVHVDRDQGLLALHDVGDRASARRAQDPGEQAGADRAVRRIDHEHFPEIGGQVLASRAGNR